MPPPPARTALLLLLLSTGPAVAAAQDPRLERRLDSLTAAAVGALLDSARAVGLPTEPLVDRALEGASKRAPGSRIVAAVRLRLTELEAARAALGSGSSTAELDVASAALHVGASPADLTRLRTTRPAAPLVVPLAVLTDLVARGVPADTATGLVLALATVVPDEALLAFRRDVERDIALGAPPLTAATIRAGIPLRDATSLGQSPGTPPRRVRP